MRDLEKISSVVKSDVAGVDTVVYKFEPRHFDTEITKQAQEFVSSQTKKTNDFRIDEKLSQQIGLANIEKSRNEEKIEQEVLTRLKAVQESAYQEAYDLGKMEGVDKAFADYKIEIEKRVKGFDETLESLQQALSDIYKKQEEVIIKLVYETAKKIAMFEIENRPETILEILKNLVDEIQSDERILVKLSEKDLELVKEYHEKLDSNLEFLNRVKVESSTRVSSGGCLLETNDASINATITQRVNRVWQALEESLPVVHTQNINEMKESDDGKSDDEESEES